MNEDQTMMESISTWLAYTLRGLVSKKEGQQKTSDTQTSPTNSTLSLPLSLFCTSGFVQSIRGDWFVHSVFYTRSAVLLLPISLYSLFIIKLYSISFFLSPFLYIFCLFAFRVYNDVLALCNCCCSSSRPYWPWFLREKVTFLLQSSVFYVFGLRF